MQLFLSRLVLNIVVLWVQRFLLQDLPQEGLPTLWYVHVEMDPEKEAKTKPLFFSVVKFNQVIKYLCNSIPESLNLLGDPAQLVHTIDLST